MQIDLFGTSNPEKNNSTKAASKTLRHENVEEFEESFVINHKNASVGVPDHQLLLDPHYDAKSDTLNYSWDEQELISLWDGILTEHLKMLRQTKPGSKTRNEILEWQESENFKELCSAVSYNPDEIREGVLSALEAYDVVRPAQQVISKLMKLDSSVIDLVQEIGMTRKECNSRLFKQQLTDWFLTQFKKANGSELKINRVNKLMYSQELHDLADQIGTDISGVINQVKPKLYFVLNPEDLDYEV